MTSCGLYIVFYKETLQHNPFRAYTPLLDVIWCLFLGYSLYDSAVMLLQETHWSMWVHHVLGVAGAIGKLVTSGFWVGRHLGHGRVVRNAFSNHFDLRIGVMYFRTWAWFPTCFLVTEVSMMLASGLLYLDCPGSDPTHL